MHPCFFLSPRIQTIFFRKPHKILHESKNIILSYSFPENKKTKKKKKKKKGRRVIALFKINFWR